MTFEITHGFDPKNMILNKMIMVCYDPKGFCIKTYQKRRRKKKEDSASYEIIKELRLLFVSYLGATSLYGTYKNEDAT